MRVFGRRCRPSSSSGEEKYGCREKVVRVNDTPKQRMIEKIILLFRQFFPSASSKPDAHDATVKGTVGVMPMGKGIHFH